MQANQSYKNYHIASNKRRGRSFNFWHFLGGVYSREAFTWGRRLLKNTEKLQFYISASMISSSSSIRKTALSASTTFLETVNQTIFWTTSVKIETTRFEWVGKVGEGAFIRRGVHKTILKKRGAFIRGRRFLEVGRLFEAIRYAYNLWIIKTKHF